MQIEQTEIDGVTVLWADVGPGTTIGALSFGVGRADETAATGGITHLVEHLALARFGQQDFDHNGFVDGTRTVLHAAGTPAEIAAHLTAVARSLSDIPWDRVALERRILQDEAAQREPGIAGALLWYRFGSAGHGLPGVHEHGLSWLGPDRVRPWIAERYTKANAVLWLSGPPPPGLRLELPEGPRPQRPAVEPLADLVVPAHVPWQGPGVAVAYLANRSSESNVAASILERRARQALRFEKGLVYDIAFDYLPLDASTAHVVFGADCPEDRIPAVRAALFEVIDGLAASGPTDAELAAERAAFARGLEERDGRIGYLDVQAAELLLGQPLRQPDELAARRAAVTSDGARTALDDALSSVLLLANEPPLAEARWTTYPAWSRTTVTGHEYRPSGFHLPGRAPKERLLVGADGVSARLPQGSLTVRWVDVVAVIHEAPTVRTVIGRDGFQVTVAAEAWKDGAGAVAAIDAAVPAAAVACGEHGLGGLEELGAG